MSRRCRLTIKYVGGENAHVPGTALERGRLLSPRRPSPRADPPAALVLVRLLSRFLISGSVFNVH